ncbi:MAG TPA: serine hydrolase [Mycobacteriales bacterium]|nr:serine hydrolase [Mycobacteriales bacterium]
MSRTRTVVLCWCAAAVTTLAAGQAAPAAATSAAHVAAPRVESATAIGGPLLSRRGTVVHSTAGVPALPSGVSAAAWVVADLTTGDVLAARNAHGRFLPASTIKTLTAVALIPELERGAVHTARLDDVNVEGSKVGLVPREQYRVNTLFESLLVVSGNDAANSLATAAGGHPRAISLMNATARRLQALDTVARNPSGLDDPEQLTSAYDLALITREGMTMPSYRTYVSTLRSRVNAPGGKSFEIYNHNKLLTRYAGTTGGKTGYTVAARRTFVVTAKRGERELVVSLLRAETMLPDATKLLDWGFAAAARAQPVGHLVDPIADATGAVRAAAPERADRSSRSAATRIADLPDPLPVSSAGVSLPMKVALPAGGVGLLLVAAGLRRRQIRRRRYGGTSGLSLKLPVR